MPESGKIDKRLLRTRIGEPGSPIMPGDPTPGGGVYRGGQFAPTMDELSTLSLVQANSAGLLSKNLPIFDARGEVDERKLEAWTPKISGVHINSKVPKYSSAVLVDTLSGRDSLIQSLGLSYIDAGDREEQNSLSIYGEVVIKAKYASRNGFTGRLVVYPSFYKYVSTPLVGKVPGVDQGLSIASYAVFHSLGHLLFARLMYDGKIKEIGELMETSGWSKHESTDNTQASYLEYVNHGTVWKRRTNVRVKTEASKFTPMDDFAELFSIRLTNPKYLEKAFPSKYELISSILEDYGHVL